MKQLLHWLAALALSLAATLPAHAFQPESGLWVVSEEVDGKPGRGFNLDVQGDTLVLSFYGYLQNGAAQWYLASGPVQNNQFNGSLEKYEGGKALGSGQRQSARGTGSAGMARIAFKTADTGTITLPGEPEKAIQRFNFNRPTPTSSLAGTFTLVKILVIDHSTGNVVDTSSPGIAATGTMVSDGRTMRQTLFVTANGGTQQIRTEGRVVSDQGSSIVVSGAGSSYTTRLLKRGDELITVVKDGSFVEIDYWRRTSAGFDANQLKAAELAPHEPAATLPLVGGVLGALLD